MSTKTVSRVTNGDEYVAAGTAERVRRAIERLGYRANPLARSLRKGRDEAVAIIVESIADVFFSFMVDAVEKVARDAGLFLIVVSAGRTADEERAVVEDCAAEGVPSTRASRAARAGSSPGACTGRKRWRSTARRARSSWPRRAASGSSSRSGP